MNGTDVSDCPESIDTALDLLSDRHRRTLCRYVSGTKQTVFSTDELVEQLSTGTEDRARLKVELTHVHLPMMAEKGVLEYDRRQGTVRFDDNRFGTFCRELEAAMAAVGCLEAD